jgi:hypothetical protein
VRRWPHSLLRRRGNVLRCSALWAIDGRCTVYCFWLCLVRHDRRLPSMPQSPCPQSDSLETIIVSVTPLMGTGIPLNQVPSNVQTLRAPQFDNDHTQTLTDELDRHLASVTLADTEGNPFQEDLVERGFTASPVLGTPQGLALYQNGVRINEAFGDIVLWDFIPVFAIEELQELPGSNPVFGLNALGGAITLKMKDGFDFQNTTAELAGGSFGRYRATLQEGATLGDSAFYLGANVSHDDGWRQLSSSDVVQTFADAALRGDDYSLGASLTVDWNHLNGNGADPAQDDPTAAFAVPDLEIDHLVFLQTRGTKNLTRCVLSPGHGLCTLRRCRNSKRRRFGLYPMRRYRLQRRCTGNLSQRQPDPRYRDLRWYRPTVHHAHPGCRRLAATEYRSASREPEQRRQPGPELRSGSEPLQQHHAAWNPCRTSRLPAPRPIRTVSRWAARPTTCDSTHSIATTACSLPTHCH